MNFIKWFFIIVLMTVLLGGGGYGVYYIAYAEGETMGYEEGYATGLEEGCEIGEKAGYEDGYSSGEQDGFDKGYVSGKEDGYTTGEHDGYDQGYYYGLEQGYSQGYSEGAESGPGNGYTLRDPTYQEVLQFLNDDRTDENEYIEGSYGAYVCSHFARDLCNNAEKQGIRSAFVELRYDGSGHTIVAFNTIDEGLVFFEPQSDERANPAVGLRYYQTVVPDPGHYYVKPEFDDTIMDILVIW